MQRLSEFITTGRFLPSHWRIHETSVSVDQRNTSGSVLTAFLKVDPQCFRVRSTTGGGHLVAVLTIT